MKTKEINETWEEWLEKERHISLRVAKEAGLYFNGPLSGSLTIPVWGLDGTWLFNKYRRSPILSAGPKYRYDKGASRALYGIEQLHYLPERTRVVVSEGELDSLALRTLGYVSVSSTGGAGTWAEEFSKTLQPYETVLFYDADEPGVRGMLHAATFMRNIRLAWMPVQYGKDPTEIVHNGRENSVIEAIDSAKKYTIPYFEDEIATQILDLDIFKKELAAEKAEILNDFDRTPFHVDIALQWASEQRTRLEGELFSNESYSEPRAGSGDIVQARAYPIKNLIKVNNFGFAKCPFHEDGTASFKVYPDNHAYCFGGCGRKSSIDIYILQNFPHMESKLAFKEALKALTNITV